MLGALMTGVSLEQAGRKLGDRTRSAEPRPADLERGRLMIARYRQASDMALGWMRGMASGV
jgi:hypothetical protein